MKILVWECQCCSNRACILPFTGTKNSCGFERPDFCIQDCTCGTYPWKLIKIDEQRILDYYINANHKWIKEKNK